MRRAVLLVVGTVGLAGCFGDIAFHRKTVTRFKDPSLVRVDARTNDDRVEQVLAAGQRDAVYFSAPGEAEVKAARVGKSLRLTSGQAWRELVSEAGETTMGTPDVKAPEYRLTGYQYFCGDVTWGSAGAQQRCTSLHPVLVTPWTNVEDVVAVKDPSHGMGGLLVPGALFTVVGLVVLGASDSAGTGLLLTLVGLGLDATGIYFLVAPPAKTTLYPEAKPPGT